MRRCERTREGRDVEEGWLKIRMEERTKRGFMVVCKMGRNDTNCRNNRRRVK